MTRAHSPLTVRKATSKSHFSDYYAYFNGCLHVNLCLNNCFQMQDRAHGGIRIRKKVACLTCSPLRTFTTKDTPLGSEMSLTKV